jgi:hypothetical protein
LELQLPAKINSASFTGLMVPEGTPVPTQPNRYRQTPVINSAIVRPTVIPANTANTVNIISFILFLNISIPFY